jgi:hypothetical protein
MTKLVCRATVLSILFQYPVTRITGPEGSDGADATAQAKMATCGGTILGTAHFTNPSRYIKMNFCCPFVHNVTIDWQLNYVVQQYFKNQRHQCRFLVTVSGHFMLLIVTNFLES